MHVNAWRDKPITYCGLEIAWDAEKRTCKIGQDKYVEALKVELDPKEQRRRFGERDLVLSKADEIDLKLAKVQQDGDVGVVS